MRNRATFVAGFAVGFVSAGGQAGSGMTRS